MHFSSHAWGIRHPGCPLAEIFLNDATGIADNWGNDFAKIFCSYEFLNDQILELFYKRSDDRF